MKKTPLIFGTLILVVLSGVVAYPIVARQLQNRRYSASAANNQTKFSLGTPDFQSKIWQTRAKTFDRNKASAHAVFAGATKVEAFRLFSNSSEKQIGKINAFPYFSKSVIEKDFSGRLSTLVLDAKSYPFPGDSTRQCYFKPGVNFRIWNKSKFIDTIICLSCNQLAVLENNPKVPENNMGGSLQGRFYVAGDFDSG